MKNQKRDCVVQKSGGLATAAVATASAMRWEVEEDHLLSYFLGGDGAAETGKPAKQNGKLNSPSFKTSRSVSSPRSNRELRNASNGEHLLGYVYSSTESKSTGPNGREHHISNGITYADQSSSLPAKYDENSPLNSNQLAEDSFTIESNDMHASFPPPNRTVSFGLHKVPSTASSSSSSLSAMAAALAIGGPSQVHYIQQHLQTREIPTMQHSSFSPLTPVNLVGSPSGQEMMMLPPPPRFQSCGGNDERNTQTNFSINSLSDQEIQQELRQSITSAQGQPQWNQGQVPSPNTQQHLKWIKQMNDACLAAQKKANLEEQGAQLKYISPSTVPSSVLSQPQQVQGFKCLDQTLEQPLQHIQVGVDGATIPITAIKNTNGSYYYHIDPNVVPSSGLKFFTKAINKVINSEEPKKEDPTVIAEKRQRRLARNRESARQSRRRKKEHLANLAEKVNRLQRQLESDVRMQINTMESCICHLRFSMLEKFVGAGASEHEKESLVSLLQRTSINSPIRRAVIVHQYNCLRQALLSTHNQFSIWLLMQSSHFFTSASQLSQKPSQINGAKTTNSRPNSKQVGEEIFCNEKTIEKALTSCASDASRMWPLFCHEITMTMDQEERIINEAHQQAKDTCNLQTKLVDIEKVTATTHGLRNAILCISQFSSQKNESILLSTLTSSQTSLFLQWSKDNKERCREALERHLSRMNNRDCTALSNLS